MACAVKPIEEKESRLIARYLYPRERFRGECRRHWLQPAIEVTIGIGAGISIWRLGEIRLQTADIGLPERELTIAPATLQIGVVVALWCLWRTAAWHFHRFSLTNRRLMVVSNCQDLWMKDLD